jgi:lipoprotein-anchoring transpeptidase ErfK/SrfK
MYIEWREFINNHWRFGYTLLFWTLCLGGLLIIALINFIALEGRAGQKKQQVVEKTVKQQAEKKPRADQTSLSLPGVSDRKSAGTERESTVADPLGTRAEPRETPFSHIEVNLSRQTLSVVDESGKVSKVLPISSGSGKMFTSEGVTRRAVTPRGRFAAYRKIPGWRKSPLGLLYYPVYITGGIAIHGSPSVPRRPASHGCIRIPMSAAKAFYDSTPVGTVVLVY